MRFSEYDIVDVGRLDSGSPDRFLQNRRREYFGGVLTNEPLNDVPMAVRTALTMTGLGMCGQPSDSGACKRTFETPIVSATVATTITGACWLLGHAETLETRDRRCGVPMLFRQPEYFVAVAQERHFARAAE